MNQFVTRPTKTSFSHNSVLTFSTVGIHGLILHCYCLERKYVRIRIKLNWAKLSKFGTIIAEINVSISYEHAFFDV